jgi:hypothetical protein
MLENAGNISNETTFLQLNLDRIQIYKKPNIYNNAGEITSKLGHCDCLPTCHGQHEMATTNSMLTLTLQQDGDDTEKKQKIMCKSSMNDKVTGTTSITKCVTDNRKQSVNQSTAVPL